MPPAAAVAHAHRMITLHAFPRCWGLPNIGPTCTKVETYLRMTDREYRVAPGDLRKAPRNQLPFIEIDGATVSDSNHIIERLERDRETQLGEHLTPAQRGQAHALARMLEESTVWGLRHARFIADEGWRDTLVIVRSILPVAVRWFAPSMIRRGMRDALHGQGMGRFTSEQIYGFVARDLDAVATALGESPFLFGDRPHVADAAIFGMVGNLACEHAPSPLPGLVRARPNLVAHVERMRERFFPELPSWIGVRREGALPAAT